jgi:hypothetical protein
MADPQPPASPLTRAPRHWSWYILRGIVLGVAVGFVLEAGRVFLFDNFHAVLPGQVYRCNQLSPGYLEYIVRRHGIRTVLNLRGVCARFPWYLNECRTTHRLGVDQEDVCLSAGRLPPVHELRRLVEVLENSPQPILMHCNRGADRTGLVSALATLLLTDTPLDRARRQLGIRAGHIPLGRPRILGEFFTLYEEWLARREREHSSRLFRRWLLEEYCPGACRARIELLDPPDSLPVRRPFGLRVRVTNTSVRTWTLSQENNVGVHLSWLLHDARADFRSNGRSGLFDAEVAPGASIELTLSLPALPEPGRYRLMVDMTEEGHCSFAQAGSEPLEEEFVAREQHAPQRKTRQTP